MSTRAACWGTTCLNWRFPEIIREGYLSYLWISQWSNIGTSVPRTQQPQLPDGDKAETLVLHLVLHPSGQLIWDRSHHDGAQPLPERCETNTHRIIQCLPLQDGGEGDWNISCGDASGREHQRHSRPLQATVGAEEPPVMKYGTTTLGGGSPERQHIGNRLEKFLKCCGQLPPP